MLRAGGGTFLAMGRGILREGVETPEQYALACTLRADRLQGYLSGAPNAGRGALCSDAQRRAAHAQNLKRLWLQPLK